MKRIKQVCSVLLVLLLLLQTLPTTAFAQAPQAEESTEPIVVTEETPVEAATEQPAEEAPEASEEEMKPVDIYTDAHWRNPMYADLELPVAEPEKGSTVETKAINFQTPERAAATLKQALLERQTPIKIYVRASTGSVSTEEELVAWIQYVWAVLLAEATMHDKNTPAAGDYLTGHIYDIGGGIYCHSLSAYWMELELDYEPIYTTTAQQEAAVDAKVDSVMEELALSGKTDFQKVKAIYDYMAPNVIYETADPESLTGISPVTAYGALVEGRALYPGYVLLFYRLALEAGLNARVIAGTAEGEPYLWNIVGINGLYYNVDITVDAIMAQSGAEYAYFLKSQDHFADHVRDAAYLDPAFLQAYPMSEVDYPLDYIAFGKCGDSLYWKLDDAGLMTIFGTGTMYDNPNFLNNKELVRNLVVEDGATDIGMAAFYEYTNLETVILPDSVTSIDNNAFYNCRKLKQIRIPANLTAIWENAFRYCESLTAVELPQSLYWFQNGAFYGCKQLTTVTIPDSITTVPAYAFGYCESLQTVTLGNRTEKIGSNAFEGCAALVSIAFPETVTDIGYQAFGYCANLQNVVLPAGLNTLGGFAFGNCTSLKSIVIPQNVTKINDYTFSGCTALESVTLCENLTEIGGHAFMNCESLKEIELPEGVTKIGNGVFFNCHYLERITWPSMLTYIGSNAFSNCYALTEVILPESVTVLGQGAFSGCTALERVVLPTNMNLLEAVVFKDCVNLTSVTLGQNMTKMRGPLFGGCIKLETIILPESLTEIGDYTFADAVGLKEITIPAGVTTLGSWAFRDCTSLEKVIFKGNVPGRISNNAFENVVAAVYYPAGNETWTEEMRQNYGGTLTWSDGCPGEHEYESLVTPPTCTDAGYTTHTCSVCGYVLVDSEVPALGHSYQSVVTPATCTEAGFTTHTCSHCGDSYTDIPVDALGHNMGAWTPDGGAEISCCQNEGCDYCEYKSGAENLTTGQKYGTLAEALAEANPGDTVKLIADNDASGETLILRPGVTLHLGAYDLIADGFIGFNGSILDATRYSATGDYGKLIVPKENLVLSGGQAAVNGNYDVIPVWNGEDAYILANALVNDTEGEYGLKIDEENKTIRFSFVHKVGGSANNAFFKDGTGDNALKIIIRLEWASGNGVAYQDFVYNDDFVGLVSGGGYNYSFVLNNYDILNIDLSNLKVTAMILTDAGTITAGQAWTQANAIE